MDNLLICEKVMIVYLLETEVEGIGGWESLCPPSFSAGGGLQGHVCGSLAGIKAELLKFEKGGFSNILDQCGNS